MQSATLLGVLLAAVATAANNVGKGLQKVGSRSLPAPATGWRAVWACRTSGVFLGGAALDLAGALLTVPALALAAVSVVQPVLTAGMAILVIFSHAYLGERMDGGCRLGLWLCIGGAVGVGATLGEVVRAPAQTDTLGPLAAAGAIVAALELVRRTTSLDEPAAGLQAGTCFGTSAVLLRALLASASWSSDWPLIALALGSSGLITALGFFFQTRGFIAGRAALVGTYGGVTALLFAVGAGALSLGEPLPASISLRAVRLLGYALVASGAVLMGRRRTAARD